MSTVDLIFSTIFTVCILAIVYLFYQISRNNKVFKIRTRWIDYKDDRYDKYTYEEMFVPSFKNYYGLKYPKDKHFK